MLEASLWEKISDHQNLMQWGRVENACENGHFDTEASQRNNGYTHFVELKTDEITLRPYQQAWAMKYQPARRNNLWMLCYYESTAKFHLFHLKNGKKVVNEENYWSWEKDNTPWPRHIRKIEKLIVEKYEERFWKEQETL